MSSFDRILVTTDLSEHAAPGVAHAARLARALGSEIVLLFVIEDQLPPIVLFTSEEDRLAVLDRARGRAEERLRAYAEEHLDGCTVEVLTVVGVPVREILHQAKVRDADLIVMASAGYGPVRQVLLGSTTERVLHHATCPVLVVPSRDDP